MYLWLPPWVTRDRGMAGQRSEGDREGWKQGGWVVGVDDGHGGALVWSRDCQTLQVEDLCHAATWLWLRPNIAWHNVGGEAYNILWICTVTAPVPFLDMRTLTLQSGSHAWTWPSLLWPLWESWTPFNDPASWQYHRSSLSVVLYIYFWNFNWSA